MTQRERILHRRPRKRHPRGLLVATIPIDEQTQLRVFLDPAAPLEHCLELRLYRVRWTDYVGRWEPTTERVHLGELHLARLAQLCRPSLRAIA